MVTNQSELRTFTSSYTLASKTSDYHPGMTSKEVYVVLFLENAIYSDLDSLGTRLRDLHTKEGKNTQMFLVLFGRQLYLHSFLDYCAYCC
jgi:hypothetical protein